MTTNLDDSFGEWLLSQRHRQDPVGDLARDYSEAYDGNGRHPLITHEYLDSVGAIDGAHAALDQARHEWSAQT